MKRKIKMLFTMLLTVCLAAALLVTGTYALFTDTATVGTHLQAGKLEVTLIRDSYVKYAPNAQGLYETVTYNDDEDFTETSLEEKDLFDFTATKLVPGAHFTANMKITNNSDVAFGYYIEIVPATGNDPDFINQVKIEAITPLKTVGGLISNSYEIGSETNFIGEVLIGETQEFSIKVTFENILTDGENNKAMSEKANFDIVVYAVQLIKEA